MRKLIAVASAFILSTGVTAAFGQEMSNEEVLQKLQQLEEQVAELKQENQELKSLLGTKGYTAVGARKRTRKIQVVGRVVTRYSITQNSHVTDSKTLYGDTPNSMIVRKARIQVKAKLSKNVSGKIHIRADRGTGVRLWDAFIDYKFDAIPLKLRIGQQKIPVSMSYLRPGPKIWFPERPIVVRKMDSHDRDVGIRAILKPSKLFKVEAAVMNGEGVKTGESTDDLKNKVDNSKDRRLSYVFAVDAKPVNTDMLGLRVRAAYETGYSYLYYQKYQAQRNLFDIEASAKIKPVGLTLEGGYSYDNPDIDNYGNAKGYYVQAIYKVPVEQLSNLYLLGRYSYFDPNDDKGDDDYRVTTLGFDYFLNGWQAAIRTAYVWVNDSPVKNGKDQYGNMLVTEFQFLF